MPLVAGIDEAGYGPTLGPLVVAATLWTVPSKLVKVDFWKVLENSVRRCGRDGDARLVVDDSKAVFNRKQGLSGLERPVLAFARAAGVDPATLEEFLAQLGARLGEGDEAVQPEHFMHHVGHRGPTLREHVGHRGPTLREHVGRGGPTLPGNVGHGGPTLLEHVDHRGSTLRYAGLPWYDDLSLALPTDRARSKHEGIANLLKQNMNEVGLACCGLKAEVVTEDRFNQRVTATRNKAAVLSEQVLRLIQFAAQRSAGGDLVVRVDRLGGRTDYRALLAAAFPERHVRILEVADERSRYRLSSGHDDWFIEFAIAADRQHLPVALASMLAKYLRELLMRGFNAYWRQRVPSLRPTAGYYTDARRFLAEIDPAIAATGLARQRFVRVR